MYISFAYSCLVGFLGMLDLAATDCLESEAQDIYFFNQQKVGITFLWLIKVLAQIV